MDIWEKLQTVENNLFSLEQTLQSAAKSFPDPIFIIDRNGKYLDVIGGKERSVYHSGEFCIGRYLHDVLPDNLADILMQTISEAIDEGALKTVEYQLNPEDMPDAPIGLSLSSQWFEARISPIKDQNDQLNSVIFLPINIDDKKKLVQQIKTLSERDPMTGAFNRRHFMQIFEKEFSITKRYKTRLSVLHIDIDNLNEINARYGHGSGDAVLKRFAAFCENTLRESDMFARFVGESFMVMLPGTTSLGAAIIAERLRARAEELRVPFNKGTVRFTVSIGISQATHTDTTSSAVLSRAENALYQAKKKGRNTIRIS